jgi:hypothetical protein
MPGQSELTDDEHIHRRPQRNGYFVRDRNAAARKCQDHQIGAVPEVFEPAGEDYASVSSIVKPQRLRRPPWNRHTGEAAIRVPARAVPKRGAGTMARYEKAPGERVISRSPDGAEESRGAAPAARAGERVSILRQVSRMDERAKDALTTRRLNAE